MRLTGRARLALILVIPALIAGGGVLATGAASAATRDDCHAWIHSTSAFTGGGSAVCNGGPTRVQYRVTVLCKHRFNWHGGRFVSGWWMNNGVSFAGCDRSEIPINAFYSLR